jgi:hypothetical protein
VRVNKGGSAAAQVRFEYTVRRDCGATCGGTRRWVYDGPVGLGLQKVEMNFSEETKQ